jgi:hypothetical protein
MVETVLEKVDDLLVGNIDYSGALVKKAPHVLRKVSSCSCFTMAKCPCEYPSVPWHPRSCW